MPDYLLGTSNLHRKSGTYTGRVLSVHEADNLGCEHRRTLEERKQMEQERRRMEAWLSDVKENSI